MATKTRRQFLSDNFAAATSFAAAAALGSLGDRFAYGESLRNRPALRPVKDETTGLALLRLPPGFRYKSYGWAGETMADGTPTPDMHDGMAVIAAEGDTIRLCRNHEISSDGPALHSSFCRPYDPQAQAGCTSLEFDTAKGEWLSSWVSFTGTSRNCAGGVTPWGTWLTAEETVLGIGDHDKYNDGAVRKFQKNHGWVFEVPGGKMGEAVATADPQPITGMGRFVHEAIAVDRRTGIVYQTEDRATSGFYRYVPHKPGQLHAGGVLEIAEVVGQPDLRGGFRNGVEFDVRWHRIADPTLAHTPGTFDELGVFQQGHAQGASMFSRLEGCWFGDGVVTFDATSGGAAEAGQIWQYDPQADKLKLLFESPSKPTLNMPDNLCVSPRGGIVLCEDNDYGANEYPQRMFALSQDGQLALLAENNVRLEGQWNGIRGDFRTKEWAGATFSPDGNWLFVNIQTPGITLAITGPWEDTLA